MATETGIQLIQTIQNDLLKSAELTGRWEKKLRQIEQGEYDVAQFMNEMKTMVSEVVESVKYEQVANRIGHEEVKSAKKKRTSSVKTKTLKCPKCSQGDIKTGRTAVGCSLYGKSCDFKIELTYCGIKLTAKQVYMLLERKDVSIKGLEVGGKKTDGVLTFGTDLSVSFKEVNNTLKCPKCAQGTIIGGKGAYGCSNWKTGCNFTLPIVIYNKKLTRAQLKKLISKGKTPAIKGFTTNTGVKFNAVISFNEDFTLNFEKR